jgi:hypothetical protein
VDLDCVSLENPYFHQPLEFSSLRDDAVEEDEGIPLYLEENKERIIDEHFAMPKLKTDGGDRSL